MPDPMEVVLGRLRNVKRSRQGYSALCPAHDDNENSLSVNVGEDGRILLHCFAGCPFDTIVDALGLNVRDLFQSGAMPEPRRRPAVTVAALAEDKSLPVDFLCSLGLEDREGGVFIPYKELDGSLAVRHRLRTGLRAKNNSIWLFGKGKPIPYGLDYLETAREAGYVVFVEGESDLWTLRYHEFPALGIPGATMGKVLQADHLRGVEKVFVVQEPGQGGESFINGIRSRLAKIGWKGKAFVITCGGFKDPNDLHRDDPSAFADRFRAAMEASVATDIPNAGVAKSTTNAPVGEVDDILGGLQNASPAQLESVLRDLATALKDADPLRRSVVRELAVQQLKAQGVSSPAKMVDAALGLMQQDSREEQPLLSDPIPWSESVDVDNLLTRIRSLLSRFVVLSSGADIAITLWVVFVYCLAAFSIAPMLAIFSPVKRCGKTTLLALLRALVPRALPASNITPAAVFRTIEHYKPTLLLDEGDTFVNKNDELRGVINSGHTRATAIVIRTVGDNHVPQIFSTWCGKAIALIGHLSDTLEDRSIAIAMRRKAPEEKVERLRADRIDTELANLRSQAARWAADHLDTLREAEPALPQELDDRGQDNWRPLLAVADLAGGDWPELARNSAIMLAQTSSETDTAAPIQLLADIRVTFEDRGEEVLSSEELVQSLTSMEDRPWGEWRNDKPLTKIQLARLLRRFEVSPSQTHKRGERLRGYRLSQFDDCFARYLPSESGQSGQPNDFNELEADSSRDQVGAAPSRVGAGPQQESSCPESESGHPDSIPTGNLFESGQPDGSRDEFDL